jgi:lantibiotic modifying enzyme
MTRSAAPVLALALLSLTTLTAGQGQAPPPQSLTDIALDTAKWLRASAIKTDAGTVWPTDPRDPKTVNPTLYAGTPGPILFFLELHHATGDRAWLREATQGADHLLTTIATAPPAGLYSGVAGIGFTLGEVFRATGDRKYGDGARHAVDRLSATAKPVGAGVEWSPVTDIIGGTAGNGLFLIHAAEVLKIPGALDLARRAGLRLLEQGAAEAGGTKWQMSSQNPRLMPNFSHGTAGIAYFLADLHRVTNDKVFLDGALSGAKYLKAVARTDGDACLIFHHEPEEDGKNLFYLGWCHGPAGTARLWYQLYTLTGDREWLEWTERSARGITTSGIPEKQTPGFWNNVSQCCGSAGVASFVLSLHRVTGKAEYLEFARRVTRDMVARATRDEAGTRWIQAEHRVRPELLVAQTGWMQGASGMATWLLQLDGFDKKRKQFVQLPDSPFERKR